MIPRLKMLVLLLTALTLCGACGGKAVPVAPVVDGPAASVIRVGTVDDLLDRVAVREFRFRGGAMPSLRVRLENLLAESDLPIQVTSEFLAADGSVLERKEWVAASIPASREHLYLATSKSRGATAARLLLRVPEAP